MFPEQELFGAEEFFEKDDSPVDDTKITFLQIFYSEDELKLFKLLCKEGMRQMYPAEKLNIKANTSDFLLTLLKNNYGTENNSGQVTN